VRGANVSIKGQTEFGLNSSQNGIEVVADLAFEKRMARTAEPLENFGPPFVVVSKPAVLLAVDLHGELSGVAIEVGDETIERDLPSVPGPEPGDRAVEARAAQLRPWMSSARVI
jgi:N-acyl-L-homoserine lactone synthetase